MGTPSPPVSIGLPVYNGANYLAEAIDSVLGQTCGDLELIISDNASTDATEEICRGYAARDARVRYLRQETNLGAAPNYNVLFHEARGRYFKWAAHDDVIGPTMVERCLEVLEREPDVAVCAPYTRIIGPAGETLKELGLELELLEDDPARRLARFYAFHSSPRECNAIFGLIRREHLAQTDLIGSFPASDMILLARLALHGKLAIVPEYLFWRRDHEQTSIRANPGMRERGAWFDTRRPAGTRRTVWFWLWQYFRNINQAPLTVAQTVRCHARLAALAFRKRRVLVRELLTRA